MTSAIEKKGMNIKTVTPYVDAWEENDETIIMVEMPGVSDKNANVNVEKGILTVEGIVDLQEAEGYQLEHQEARCVRYKRMFELSDKVNVDGITAQMKNGVLKIILPKRDEVKTKKIAVLAEKN